MRTSRRVWLTDTQVSSDGRFTAHGFKAVTLNILKS